MLGAADELADPEGKAINDYIVGESVKVTDGPSRTSGRCRRGEQRKRKLKVM